MSTPNNFCWGLVFLYMTASIVILYTKQELFLRNQLVNDVPFFETGICNLLLNLGNIDSMFRFFNLRTMAPIKRLVSIKNTYPSQKETIFLQKQYSDRSQSLFYCLRPVFQTVVVCTFSSICYQAPIGIKADEKKQIHRPWSISGPQKNIGTLSCPKGCNKISGSLRPTIAGA